MPKVKAEIAGKILTLLGYDGSDFYNVKVDSDNLLHGTVSDSFGVPKRLQQDAVLRLICVVDKTVMDARAATEATLATLATEAKLELCRLLLVSLDGVDFATGVDIATIVTELALKADLTETQPVSVAALPLPLGASTELTLATLATEAKLELCRLLLVSIDGIDFASSIDITDVITELRLKADLTETQPVSAAALPLPAGAATSGHQITVQSRLAGQLGYYLGQIMQRNFTLSAAAGANLLTGAGPSAGEVWVVTGLSAYNDNNDEDGVFMGVFDGVNYNWLNSCGAVTAKTMLSWSGEIVLVNGDTPRCYHLGCTLNDDIYFFVYGYKRET